MQSFEGGGRKSFPKKEVRRLVVHATNATAIVISWRTYLSIARAGEGGSRVGGACCLHGHDLIL
jgi:hypothetical protein